MRNFGPPPNKTADQRPGFDTLTIMILAQVRSEALRVKGIDNFTSGQVRSRLRPACRHGVAPVHLSPTPRFVEHHVDCKKCQLIETRRRGAARNTLCNSRIRIRVNPHIRFCRIGRWGEGLRECWRRGYRFGVSRPWLGGEVGVPLGDLVAVAEEFGDQGRGDLGDEVAQVGGVAGAERVNA